MQKLGKIIDQKVFKNERNTCYDWKKANFQRILYISKRKKRKGTTQDKLEKYMMTEGVVMPKPWSEEVKIIPRFNSQFERPVPTLTSSLRSK